MTGLGFGVLWGQAGSLVSRSVKSFVSRIWIAPGIQISQAASLASMGIDRKDTSCQSLCKERQEETRKERVELRLSIPLMVSGRTMTSEPQESVHCPSNFAEVFWKWVCNSSKWCRLRVLRLAPQASCLPEIMTHLSLKPWTATVGLGWVQITCDGALHCACVREAPVLSGRVSQTGFGDNSLLYMIWASVPNSIFLSLPSLQLCEWLKVSMFVNHFSNSVGRVLSDVKDREWNMETVTVVSQIKGPIAFCFFSLCSYTADTDTNSKLFTYLLISAENTNTFPTFTRIQLLMWVNSFSPPNTRCSRANPSMWQINNQLE